MRQNVAAFFSAFIFAIGLGVGGMTDPAKIIAFLDFTGDWDPAMILVMGGAVVVYAVGYRWVLRRPTPLLSRYFRLPDARRPDGRLIVGAALFGVGWGLAGLCPGPAITSLFTGSTGVFAFVISMLVGLAAVPTPNARVSTDESTLNAPPVDGRAPAVGSVSSV